MSATIKVKLRRMAGWASVAGLGVLLVGGGACKPWRLASRQSPGGGSKVGPAGQRPAGAAGQTQPAELGSPRPVPRERIAEADAMFRQAAEAYREFKMSGQLDRERARAALVGFLAVIREYPQSDKSAEVYFFIGEVLAEYLDQFERAAEYYQRAYQTDPGMASPAHFRRAQLLDFRLGRRGEAVEEYRNSLRYEAPTDAVAAFAANRIRALTGGN